MVATMTWLTVMEYICVTNDHGYVPLVVNTSRSFPHSWLVTVFVTKLTWRVPLVDQELPTLPEHLSSPRLLVGSCYSIFSLMCMFWGLLFVLLCFFFWSLCCLFTDSDYLFGIFKLVFHTTNTSDLFLRHMEQLISLYTDWNNSICLWRKQML
jgi:hypothetical protein